MSITYDWSRLLTAPGERGSSPPRFATQAYYVRPADESKRADAFTFVTAGVNGKTSDETAMRNVADFSEWNDGVWFVERIIHGRIGGHTSVLVATVNGGLVTERPRTETSKKYTVCGYCGGLTASTSKCDACGIEP